MADPYIFGETLDDLMHSVVEIIFAYGERVNSTSGANTEITGVLLELANPRARLSRTESRGKPFSCLGEFCWYLAKSNELGFISYYLPEYKKYADGDVIFGGYGPRLFSWKGQDQIANVTALLKSKPHTRQAVIQLFDACDLEEAHNDIPCTCTLQFINRQGKLHMFVNMRSNDVHWGLPHDIFAFTMLQELLARTLAVEVGTYKHAVGSLHIYDRNQDDARGYLREGWQSTTSPMPPMPDGDPWPSIGKMLAAEKSLRTNPKVEANARELDVESYWADLIGLLEIFRYSKEKNVGKMIERRDLMTSDIYLPYIESRISQLK